MRGWPALLAAAGDAATRFGAAMSDPAAQQSAWLLDLVARNAETQFGRRHGFSTIRSIDDYRSRVPVAGYEALIEDTDAIADGVPGVRTADPVIGFEETSGSTGGRKLIPYTRLGLEDIEHGILVWLDGLVAAHPRLASGSVYWSISPVGRAPSRSRGGLPIGFPSDAAYFSETTASALSEIAAVPPGIGRIADVEAWRFLTLRTLLAREDLTFISVWSPTFLTLLLDALPALGDRLLAAINDGATGCDADRAPLPRYRPQPERARVLARALASPDLRKIWPRLCLVSAWSQGPARGAFDALRRRLPHIELDGKGLMATEGVVSLSRPHHRCPIPALLGAFLEFVDEDGRARLVHELGDGRTYRIVITTRNGFYRYDLGDLVACRGIAHGIPELEFLGRAGVVTDLVGEKLDEAFVAACLADLDGDAVLAPAASPARYLLLHDGMHSSASVANAVERRLLANPQYAYARRIGQLASLEPRACPGLRATYHGWRAQQGQTLGGIKPAVLIRTAAEAAALLSAVEGAPATGRTV